MIQLYKHYNQINFKVPKIRLQIIQEVMSLLKPAKNKHINEMMGI